MVHWSTGDESTPEGTRLVGSVATAARVARAANSPDVTTPGRGRAAGGGG